MSEKRGRIPPFPSHVKRVRILRHQRFNEPHHPPALEENSQMLSLDRETIRHPTSIPYPNHVAPSGPTFFFPFASTFFAWGWGEKGSEGENPTAIVAG
ncbi:hypothetical protein IE53DRAFT_44143 [Violaceomyces palustris]|uniref:Uncharacterized protein n=1 Tax=Violaceomyces palustris TaxID=1673888 RepID=A0ACD0P7L4_9BASI|nr:hypothetical protein IE53DRAFT_44143 [Violaceomyces palustris]